jgi:hypothetical protein
MNANEKDTYRTLATPSEEALFKEKNSKFFGLAFPVSNEEEVKNRLTEIKKTHFSARHWCYAYQIGTEKMYYRVNDDGEPNNSAGMPIYGQIQSFDITNVNRSSSLLWWGKIRCWRIDFRIQNSRSNGPRKCQYHRKNN